MTNPTHTHTPKQVVQAYIDALLAGDMDTARELFATDASWSVHGEMPISGTWRGRDAIVDDFLGSALAYYEPGSIEIEVTSMLGDEQSVAMEWTSTARTRAGRPYENGCIGIFEVRDGRISTVREYMDTDYAMKVAFPA